MQTTASDIYGNPTSIILSEMSTSHLTWDTKLDAAAVLPIAEARYWAEGALVPAPYSDPRLADIERYAVMVGEDRPIVGRVVRVGPRSWVAYSSDSSHEYGRLRSKEQAAAYLLLMVER